MFGRFQCNQTGPRHGNEAADGGRALFKNQCRRYLSGVPDEPEELLLFQTEFLTAVQRRPYESTWALIGDLCEYFYENRAFYHNALSVEGQNSFQDYFREILAPVMRAYAEDLFEGEGEDADFFINFFSDALIAAMLRWLSNRNCMPPDRFTRLLRRSVLGGAQVLSDSPVGIPS